MKKKRKLTAAEKKLNRIRAAARFAGRRDAAEYYESRLADSATNFLQYYAAYGESQRRVAELEEILKAVRANDAGALSGWEFVCAFGDSFAQYTHP